MLKNKKMLEPDWLKKKRCQLVFSAMHLICRWCLFELFLKTYMVTVKFLLLLISGDF